MDLVVGRVVKSHGVRGEVVVDVRTDSPDERFADGAVLRGRLPKGAGEKTFTVTAARDHSGRLLLSLAGVAGREAADALRGTLFLIDSSEAVPSEDPDEFYDHELIGLPARTLDGAALGIVSEVLHLAHGELLELKLAEGGKVLVPFVKAIVPTVVTGPDGYIEVDPPDGLFGDD